jgi:hypothetical protein
MTNAQIPNHLATHYALGHAISQLTHDAVAELAVKDDAKLAQIARDVRFILEVIIDDCEQRLGVVHSPEQLELTPSE